MKVIFAAYFRTLFAIHFAMFCSSGDGWRPPRFYQLLAVFLFYGKIPDHFQASFACMSQNTRTNQWSITKHSSYSQWGQKCQWKHVPLKSLICHLDNSLRQHIYNDNALETCKFQGDKHLLQSLKITECSNCSSERRPKMCIASQYVIHQLYNILSCFRHVH